jgi:hypothetical protein
LIELIDIRCSVVAVNGNDQRESDSGFGCGDGDGENCDHYPSGLVWFGAETPEGDEVEICCREHDLDADQDENGVTPAQCGQQSNAKQRGGNDEKELKRWSHGLAEVTRVKKVTWLKGKFAARPI